MVIAVDVAVTAGPDEVADFQVALLRHHVGQKRIAGDVERHAQEDVCASLVQLTAKLTFAARNCWGSHVKLKKRMARHERHLGQLGHIPSADDDASRIGVGFERVNHIADLVDVLAIRCRPATPLHTIHRTQVAVGAGPFVPNRAATLGQPVVVARTGEKPQQLDDDGFQVNFFGGDQRKTLAQIETHLVPEHAARASAGAVGFFDPVRVHVAHEIFVGGGDGGGSHGESLKRSFMAHSITNEDLIPEDWPS